MTHTELTPAERQIALSVTSTMIRAGAQPTQLKREFSDLWSCHRHLRKLGFTLVSRKDNFGGPSIAPGTPFSPLLIWRKGRVIVRIKPRGDKPEAQYRQGLAHMSVCLVSGAAGPDGQMSLEFSQELGKFTASGQLLSKGPGAAMSQAPPYLKKSASETWADDTHFLFPDLVCDDKDVDLLVPAGYR